MIHYKRAWLGLVFLVVVLIGLFCYPAPFKDGDSSVAPSPASAVLSSAKRLEAKPTATNEAANQKAKNDSVVEAQAPIPPVSVPFTAASLSVEQVERFLLKHRRDGPSLIAAFTMLDDLKYLNEAIERWPDTPEVALVALSVGRAGPDSLWIKRLQAADSSNSLAQFLASFEALTRQDGESAFQALRSARGLPKFDDYSEGRLKLIEEAALDAGYSAEKASAFAAKTPNPADALLPKYLEFASLVTSHLSNYRNQTAEVDWIIQSALKLGSELQDERQGRSVFIQAGAALYQNALYDGVRESAPFPSLSESPKDLAKQALEFKKQLVELRQAFNYTDWLNKKGDAAVVEFFNIKRKQGELQALMWAMGY